MKTGKYQRRFYRQWKGAQDLYKARIVVRQTDLHILTDKPIDKIFVKERVCLYRRQIENYIQKDTRFLSSLKPIEVELDAPPIVKEMSEAAKIANVGPMAAVAGAIAQCLGRDILSRGYKEAIIENGGDIFLKTKKSRRVAIYAGKSKLSKKLFLKINPKDSPLGICASSGTVGHSLSFGCADSVVILSKDASLSDAVATATANLVHSKDDVRGALHFASSVKGILGAVVVFKNILAIWGKIEFI